MPSCVTCGDELHPERSQRYTYCTKPGCRARNAAGLRMAAVGVNKAAEQYVILDERTEREMASGRYKKQPEVPEARIASRQAPIRRPTDARTPRPSPRRRREPPAWSEAQRRLALIYRDMGLRPEEIARKLGITPRLVTKILLAEPARSAT